jgi:mannose-6-phosphate isomerase
MNRNPTLKYVVYSMNPCIEREVNVAGQLWMGTHPKSPSLMLASGETLTSYLSKNQNLIGERVSQRFGTEQGNLPYLFKVLAIEKALSIQSHPDKATAEKLHAQQPDIYKGKPTPAALRV